MLAGDALGDGDALVFGFVREHRAAHDVADRPDAGEVGPTFGVDGDEAALVEAEPHCGRVEPLRVREPTDRDDQAVERRRLRRPGAVGVFDRDVVRADPDPR